MALVIRERDDLKGSPIDYKDGDVCITEKAIEIYEDKSKKTIIMFGKRMNLVKICFLNEEKGPIILDLESNENNFFSISGSIQKILISFGLCGIGPILLAIRTHFSYVAHTLILSYPIRSLLERIVFPEEIEIP